MPCHAMRRDVDDRRGNKITAHPLRISERTYLAVEKARSFEDDDNDAQHHCRSRPIGRAPSCTPAWQIEVVIDDGAGRDGGSRTTAPRAHHMYRR
jgi:hypothetical protein